VIALVRRGPLTFAEVEQAPDPPLTGKQRRRLRQVGGSVTPLPVTVPAWPLSSATGNGVVLEVGRRASAIARAFALRVSDNPGLRSYSSEAPEILEALGVAPLPTNATGSVADAARLLEPATATSS